MLKWTVRVCGTHPSTLERESAFLTARRRTNSCLTSTSGVSNEVSPPTSDARDVIGVAGSERGGAPAGEGGRKGGGVRVWAVGVTV